ncbi:MAG: 6-bladed beta-propeller [Candidatus Aminicenantes bacterium]|nr:6-bladed beta-propeller [Candidatus Aminicenantes bacterium]
MRNKSMFFSVVLFLAILMFVVSCGQQGAKWKGTIEEENGITVVKNPKEAIYEEDVLQLEENLTITSPEDEELMFQRLTFLDVDDNENIFVSDSKAGHILVFDKNGEFVRKIGRRGQGPGEMVFPFEIRILGQRELFVNDMGQAKAHFFTLEGEFLRQKTTSHLPYFRRPEADSVGNIVVGHVIAGEPVKTVLKKFDSELNPICEITSSVTISQPPVYDYFELQRGTNYVWNVSNTDEIIWGDLKNYEIHVCNSEGKCVKKIVRDFDNNAITGAEKNKIIKNMFGDNPVPSSMTLKFPDSYPPFIRFTCDEEGRIFVQRYDSSLEEERVFYDIFDAEGKYVGKTTINFMPQVWKNNMMYCVEADEEGFDIIKRYKVNWAI